MPPSHQLCPSLSSTEIIATVPHRTGPQINHVILVFCYHAPQHTTTHLLYRQMNYCHLRKATWHGPAKCHESKSSNEIATRTTRTHGNTMAGNPPRRYSSSEYPSTPDPHCCACRANGLCQQVPRGEGGGSQGPTVLNTFTRRPYCTIARKAPIGAQHSTGRRFCIFRRCFFASYDTDIMYACAPGPPYRVLQLCR